MNITKESLEEMIDYYQKVIWKYEHEDDYVNPNIPLQYAKRQLERLIKEYTTNYQLY